MLNKIVFIAIVFTGLLAFNACTWDKMEEVTTPTDTCMNYPVAVAQIIVNKCATAGCHNSISSSAASGLDLSNWNTMKKGNDAGAVVIPGNADYSTIFSFCNTYSDIGFTGNEPKMPYNGDTLSREEMIVLKD